MSRTQSESIVTARTRCSVLETSTANGCIPASTRIQPRRFRINGKYFITSDHLPEPLDVLYKNVGQQRLQDVHVDTMLLDGHMLVCLHVAGTSLPFDSTGHYPIIAGYLPDGQRLYIAAVRVEWLWYFTTAMDGASSVRYTDEVGDEREADDFFVLALRYEPSDIVLPYPRSPKGAMDATKPVFWMRLWPEKDPDYFEDERLTDDLFLKSLLDGLAVENNNLDLLLVTANF
ncbi:hypothetical protein SCHPADRAFT_578078 [Schizopora paradoxa]|uniref:Uncharacterized protein n=1 Tax=Schizopora paradoxa TaxID=27342 RepID=A0A0H2RBG8_9AGAM|nr:hypothetical protein SCHPADRAFT_578078 [Schizopora paradoxa]